MKKIERFISYSGQPERTIVNKKELDELESKLDIAIGINELSFKAVDYRKRHQHKLIYEEIEILKALSQLKEINGGDDDN